MATRIWSLVLSALQGRVGGFCKELLSGGSKVRVRAGCGQLILFIHELTYSFNKWTLNMYWARSWHVARTR